MMTLFSSFNPLTSQTTNMNWLMMLIPIYMQMTPYWKTHSIMTLNSKNFITKISNQFKSSMKKINSPNMMMSMMILMMILSLNMTSMLPNTFSVTSHIMMNMSLSMIMWMALMTKKMNNKINILSSLTPSNTPPPLMPFMVLIELISMMIQPLTLSIRLTANVTAGHIMMILISHMYQVSMISSLMLNLMMMILELGVSLIQAYVFSMLIIMYMK